MFQLQLARHHLNTHTNTHTCNMNIKESGLFMSTKPFAKSSEKVLQVTLASERRNLPSLFIIYHNLTTMHFINEFVPFPQCVLSNLLAKISFSESSTTNITTHNSSSCCLGKYYGLWPSCPQAHLPYCSLRWYYYPHSTAKN